MINHIQASLDGLAAHFIGNQAEGADITFSQKVLDIQDVATVKVLFKYFISHFKEPEYFNFTFSSGQLELNPIYNFVANIFDDPSSLHEQSVKIARHLYEKSKHPNIKEGEMYVVYFSNVLVDDELTEAIGIFKSENKDHFIKLHKDAPQFKLEIDAGTNVAKLDKGCLIFNVDRDAGFKLCNIDYSNRYNEAKYWRDDFLVISPASDDYHQTKNYIQATKSFIKDRMPKEFDTDQADSAAAMGRSFEYFKNNEKFDAPEYEKKVFINDKVVDAFKDFKEEYQNLKAASLFDQFDISDHAVKKQSRVFKSVIKLDKNFHIYVHGDREKIQKGQDDAGRKYYILYYDDET